MQQNVSSQTRLILKLRMLYRDVAELTESSSVYLYYLQAKRFILSGFTPITENQVVDFASLQLQALFGDYDQDRFKTSMLGYHGPGVQIVSSF